MQLHEYLSIHLSYYSCFPINPAYLKETFELLRARMLCDYLNKHYPEPTSPEWLIHTSDMSLVHHKRYKEKKNFTKFKENNFPAFKPDISDQLCYIKRSRKARLLVDAVFARSEKEILARENPYMMKLGYDLSESTKHGLRLCALLTELTKRSSYEWTVDARTGRLYLSKSFESEFPAEFAQQALQPLIPRSHNILIEIEKTQNGEYLVFINPERDLGNITPPPSNKLAHPSMSHNQRFRRAFS